MPKKFKLRKAGKNKNKMYKKSKILPGKLFLVRIEFDLKWKTNFFKKI